MSQRTERHGRLGIVTVVAVLLSLSILVPTLYLGTNEVAAAENDTSNIEISNVRNQSGNLSVTVNATSETEVSNFTFWYDNLEGTSPGPTNLSESNIQSAYYHNESNNVFQRGDPLASDIGGGKVTFVFDSTSSSYDYESNPFQVNVTVNDESYAAAARANRSVYTTNFYRIEAEDHNGNQLANVPVLLADEQTNQSKGFAFMVGNNLTFDCQGVEMDGMCANPDGSAGVLSQGGRETTEPLAVKAFSLSQANASERVDPTLGTTTLNVSIPTAPTFMYWQHAASGTPPTVDNVTVINTTSGNIVWQSSWVTGSTGAPVLLKANTEYTVTLENKSSFGTENRSVILPTKGMSNVGFKITDPGLSTSTVTGQVVNESGNPVSGAIVIAQPEYSSGSQLSIYNSTTTDENGVFTMELPQTDVLGRNYGFRLIGTDTSDGTPIYYPTIDANDGSGYVAPSNTTVIPSMTIREGGRVDIDVTSGKPQLPISSAFTSLSQESTAYPSTERTALSNGFSTFAFDGNTPSSASVALMSPTTGSDTHGFYTVWGTGTPTGYLCANQVQITKGSSTGSTCELENASYLNLSVNDLGSVVQPSTPTVVDVESDSFFFQNELVIRNATSKKVVTHLGPDGAQQFFLEKPGTPKNISIPLPSGNYTVELRPMEWTRKTSVNETSSIEINTTENTTLQLDRGDDFQIQPVHGQFDRSLERTGGNTLAVRVLDPVTDAPLSDTELSVGAQLLHLNGTVASDTQSLTYFSSENVFNTSNFDPSSLDVDAGRYELAITATNSSGSRNYTTSVSRPVQVTGFDTAVDLDSSSVGPGNTLNGQIRAYSGGSGINASADNVSIQIYNENGQVVNETNPSQGISSGTGSFSVTMPDTVGQYQVAIKIISDDGTQGIAQRWVGVTLIDLEVSTDKETYEPTDSVRVTAEATNSSDGSAITDATATLWINNNRVTATTDSNGEATFDLDPATYAPGQWQRGHGVSVMLAHETDTGIVRDFDWTSFEVQAFNANAEPTEDSFIPGESSVLRVTVPPNLNVTNITVTELDGEQVQITGSQVSKVAEGVYTVDLGTQGVGQHLATAVVRTNATGSQRVTTPFAVQDYSVGASLNGRTFDAGETVSVTVRVRHPDNGSAVSGESVSANLNATNPVRAVDSASGTTGNNGEATLEVSSSVSGPHYVEVTVGEQTRRLGLEVSNVDARFEDSSGNAVTSYQASPGTTQTIYINATQDGSPVADGSTVQAAVITREGPVRLGRNSTSGGTTSIDFTIPSSVPASEYTLAARAVVSESVGSIQGTLNVTGSTARHLETDTNRSQLTPGEPIEFSAEATTGDGSAITNEPVDFVIRTEGAADKRVGTVTTDGSGIATYNYTIPTGASDGEYVLEAALNDSQSIRAFSGYRVRSISVEVQAADGPFHPGENVSLTVYANDTTTDSSVSATDGRVRLVLPDSNLEKPLSPSGAAPYSVNVTLPDDSSIVGTRSITAAVQKDRSVDSDSTLVDVQNQSEDANLTISRPVTAGTSTNVTVNGTVDETGVLTAFSPGTGSIAFNTSVTISSSSNTNTSMTIDSAGTHVVSLTVPSVGEVTDVIDVASASGTPTISVGTAVNSSAETFNKTEDIFVQTNQSGLTATLLTQNASYTVPLDQQDGGTHYGVLSTDRPSGIYVVRLDSSKAVNINNTLIEVNA